MCDDDSSYRSGHDSSEEEDKDEDNNDDEKEPPRKKHHSRQLSEKEVYATIRALKPVYHTVSETGKATMQALFDQESNKVPMDEMQAHVLALAPLLAQSLKEPFQTHLRHLVIHFSE